MSMKLANAIVVLPSQKESDKTGLERGDKVKAILIGSL